MARYNSKRIYNRLIPNGGARYNSAPFSINIFDYSKSIIDNVKSVTRNTTVKDNNITSIENISFGFNIYVGDNIATLEKTNISANLGIISDLGNIVEIISLLPFPINITDNNLTTNETVNINSVIIYNDSGNGIDSVTYRLGAFYNTKLQYNKGINKGGSIYNSSKHLIIVISESGNIDEKEAYIVQACFVYDNGQGNDNSNITNELSKLFDNGISADSFKNITNNVDISETGHGEDIIVSILSNVNISENGYGIDFISLATTYFFINEDNVLNPLGVLVTRDTREEILSAVKNFTEKVPGKHGEYKFKSEIKGKILELTVVTDEGLTPQEKENLKNLFAEYLSPLNGEKSLTFADDIERQYKVRYSGRINIENYPTWFKFVIPFKMSSSFITGSFENVQIGSGTIENKGNVDTHMIIEIGGLAVNPSLTINGEVLNYTGTINAGETLVIDTKKRTAKIGDTNVLDNWCKKFPVLKPETTVEVTASNNIIMKWRESWI